MASDTLSTCGKRASPLTTTMQCNLLYRYGLLSDMHRLQKIPAERQRRSFYFTRRALRNYRNGAGPPERQQSLHGTWLQQLTRGLSRALSWSIHVAVMPMTAIGWSCNVSIYTNKMRTPHIDASKRLTCWGQNQSQTKELDAPGDVTIIAPSPPHLRTHTKFPQTAFLNRSANPSRLP